MIAGLPLSFAEPALLLGLLSLPVLWWLLRVMPPRPRRIEFPPTRLLFDIAPSAFVPPPKVTSSVVRLTPRLTPQDCDREALARITEAAFGQRRKMLRQSLKVLGVDPLRLLCEAGLDPMARAEQIPVAGFVALARRLVAAQSHPPP